VETLLTRSIDEAADVIRRGGLVAFPTETVYGLGADVFNETAVGRIFEAKERPDDNPLIAHLGDLAQLSDLADEISDTAHKLIGTFFPGPLTIVLRKSTSVPMIATAGLDTIGVRMPRHALAQSFLAACGTPLVAPSANLSGRPSPTTWQAVFEDLDDRIDCILAGEATEIGLESTVVDCTSSIPVLLRKGAVPIEALRDVVPHIRELANDDGDAARSPGVKHRHYSPKATIVLVSKGAVFLSSSTDAYIGLTKPPGSAALVQICDSVEDYAASLFEFFRECDRKNVAMIFCENVPEQGIGAALMDRIRRASET